MNHLNCMYLYLGVPRIGKFIGTEIRIEVMRSWGAEGKRELLFIGTEFIRDDKKVLDIDSGDDYKNCECM